MDWSHRTRFVRVPRKAFTLLLSFLLLQPPGLCLCRLVDFTVCKAEQGSGTGEVTPEAAPAKTCRCCRDRNKCVSPPARLGQNDYSTKTNQPSDQSPNPEHSQGCPANPHYVIQRASLADSGNVLTKLLLTTPVLDGIIAPCVDVSSWPVVAQPHLPSGSASLFLIQCNFRC